MDRNFVIHVFFFNARQATNVRINDKMRKLNSSGTTTSIKPRLRKEARKAPDSLKLTWKRMAELPKDIGPTAMLGLFLLIQT
jgi:hypothetical protein